MDTPNDKADAKFRLYDLATQLTEQMGHAQVCPSHGPTALLAAAYVDSCRLDGLTDAEAIARIHWIAAQARRVDPMVRKN